MLNIGKVWVSALKEKKVYESGLNEGKECYKRENMHKSWERVLRVDKAKKVGLMLRKYEKLS